MDEQRVRELIKPNVIQDDNSLYDIGWYISWLNDTSNDDTVTLDGGFTADELEAIAWWMRNKKYWRKYNFLI